MPDQNRTSVTAGPDYLRLAEPPQLEIRFPVCGTCSVDLDHDGESFTCPSCGTSWSSTAGDGERGELYAAWAGEEPSGPEVTAVEAWQVSHLRGDERQRLLERLREKAASRG